MSGVSKLIDRAKNDSDFFHSLIFDTERVLASIDFLSEEERKAILSVKPEDLIVGLASGGMKDEVAAECGGTCGASCGATCGASCGGSCTVTCAASCPATFAAEPGDQLTQDPEFAETPLYREIRSQIDSAKKFSRFNRK